MKDLEPHFWDSIAKDIIDRTRLENDDQKLSEYSQALENAYKLGLDATKDALKKLNIKDLKNLTFNEYSIWNKRIYPAYLTQAINSPNLKQILVCDKPVEACVLSIDIRKSTELMFQAIDDGKFVDFITELMQELIKSVQQCFGIIEKFTGDGLLCYFPKSFSGDHYTQWAMLAATMCIQRFDAIYLRRLNDFVSPIAATGLSAGIAVGDITVTSKIGSSFAGINIVGKSVVLACRLTGGDKGTLWATTQAVEKLKINGEIPPYYQAEFRIYDASKMSPIYAYLLRINNETVPDFPEWFETKNVPSSILLATS